VRRIFPAFVALAACTAARLSVPGGTVELDQARVEVDPFEADQHAVTAEEYAGCVKAGKCEAAAGCDRADPRDPLGCLRWMDAAAYCAWRSGRLPMDAERALLDRSATGEPRGQLLCRGPGRENPYGLCDVGGAVESWTTNEAQDGPSERASNAPGDRVATLGARCVRSTGPVKRTGIPRKLQTGVRIIQVLPPD
jgi:formylglycine-generating enzyme required for sulfatase activity